jgi:hypothetical protein
MQRGRARESTNGVAKREPFQYLNVLGHCGAHEERLENFRQEVVANDLTDVFVVTVGENQVGFVNDERFQLRQREKLRFWRKFKRARASKSKGPTHLRLQSSQGACRCCDDDIGIVREQSSIELPPKVRG